MSWRRLVLALALALALAPPASAHEGAYDPLVLEYRGFLAPEGAITTAAPEAAAIPFAAVTPASAGEPLAFSFAAPVRFAPAAGFVVNVTVRAEQPIVTGNGLEIAIEPGAAPQRIALPPAMAPGATASVSLTVQGAASYAKGDNVSVLVRPLAPALAEGAMSLLVGGETPSSVEVHEMRVPSLADLELQDAPLQQFLLEGEAFQPNATGALAHAITVGHASVVAPAALAFSPNGTWLVFRGEETTEEAQAHVSLDRDARRAAAHAFAVGSVTVRVHPGVGVVVPVASAPVVVRCVANCPPGGWSATVRASGDATAATPATQQSSLIPPPRDTRGIPVSEDDDGGDGKGVPMPALVALAALAFAARRRR